MSLRLLWIATPFWSMPEAFLRVIEIDPDPINNGS
jgi:hypothetical protein